MTHSLREHFHRLSGYDAAINALPVGRTDPRVYDLRGQYADAIATYGATLKPRTADEHFAHFHAFWDMWEEADELEDELRHYTL